MSDYSPRDTDALESSVGDYRCIIDDITIKIQRLRRKLKHYKRNWPELQKKNQELFEIKGVNLSMSKKQELDAILICTEH
jgi:hypothetical protein